MTLAGEHHLHLAYVLDDPDPEWDGTTCRMIGEDTAGETCCLLSFSGCYEHARYSYSIDYWYGHPLAEFGLEPNALYELVNSSTAPPGYRHFAMMFHDSMFECIAKGFTHTVRTASVSELIRSAGVG